LAQSAASWLERFYSGIELAFGEQSITLESDAHGAGQLHRIWRAALLNERLLEASSGQRRAALESLLQ
jgi:hypothetical protein